MTKTEATIDHLAKILWNYHLMHHKLERADAILVLGNHDLRIADYAIELFKASWAPLIIFAGGVIHKNAKLNVSWDEPEAVVFRKHAIMRGIPEKQTLVECRSKNTGENFQYTAKLLAERGLIFTKFIIVQKPYMERRTFATGKVHWPDKTLIVTSPPTSFDDYVKGNVPKNQVISFLVGDLQRIKVYGEKGLQAPQTIPEEVWAAYLQLVELGFKDRLLKE
jgi:uncharacterized SAM-binding protein YcdF (DUF218 family)